MTIGEPGSEGARVTDVQEIEQIFDVFQAHGHSEVGIEHALFTSFLHD